MIKRILTLFKIARILALSDALEIIYKFHKPPTLVKLFFRIFSFSLSKKNKVDEEKSDEEKLCLSLQTMGTSFIKLGQFLSTRPDIIGEELTKKLEKLQDRVPPYSTTKAKEILLKNIGIDNFNSCLLYTSPSPRDLG